MKIFLFFITVLIYNPAFSQLDSIAIKYAKTITAADLSKHLHVLASDEYEGRETGKKGQKMAAKYIATHFQNIGIPPLKTGGYYQEIPLEELHPEGTMIAVNGEKYEFLKDYYFFRGFNDTTLNLNEIVFVGFGIDDEKYSDYKKVNVKGKFVMYLEQEPRKKDGKSYITDTTENSKWTINRRLKVKIAKEKGAIGTFVIKNDILPSINRLKHFIQTPSMTIAKEGKENSDNLPNFYISKKMANAILESKHQSVDKIQSKINKKGKSIHGIYTTSIGINMKRNNEKLTAENVLGYIEGSDLKDQLVVITGHYDHIGIDHGIVYNGADDDGSGTVAVMEMAEAFAIAKKEGHGPRRSMLFMTVAGEEKGLLGSQYYSENPIFPLENTVVDLNTDMIGRLDEAHFNDSNYVYIIGSTMLSSELHIINEQMDSLYTPQIKLDYTYNDKDDPNRYYYRSDHYNFAKHNIPVIFYFNGVHADYHQPTDTVDKIIFSKMENISRLIFHTAWQIANQNKRIALDIKEEIKGGTK